MTSIALWLSPLFAANPSDHSAELVLEVADNLGGCAVADLDPAHAGNEIVVTSGKGAVLVVRREGEGWAYESAFQAPGEMIQVAAGDALPERPGDEIVAVGMAEGPESSAGAGAVHVIFREGSAWRSVRAFEATALVHGAAIGEDGVLVAGYDKKVRLLVPDGERFREAASADLPGNGKSILAAPRGAVVACTDGSLVEAKLADGRLVATVIDKRESGRSRMGGDREHLVVADDDGTLSLITAKGRALIHKDSSKARGAVLADLDPSSPGLEIATTGYSGRVTILREAENGGYTPSLLFTDPAGFHHAAAGELDGKPGLELVVCGMGGRVLVFCFGQQR